MRSGVHGPRIAAWIAATCCVAGPVSAPGQTGGEHSPPSDLLFPPALQPAQALAPERADLSTSNTTWMARALRAWSSTNLPALATALETSPRASAANPADVAAVRAGLAEHTGRWEDALAAWPEAALSAYVAPTAMVRAAAAALRLGRIDTARALVPAAATPSPAAAFLAGALAWMERDYSKAWRILIRPARAPGASAELRLLLARVTLYDSDYEEAIGWLRKAFEQEPELDRRRLFVQGRDMERLRHFKTYRRLLEEYTEAEATATAPQEPPPVFFDVSLSLQQFRSSSPLLSHGAGANADSTPQGRYYAPLRLQSELHRALR